MYTNNKKNYYMFFVEILEINDIINENNSDKFDNYDCISQKHITESKNDDKDRNYLAREIFFDECIENNNTFTCKDKDKYKNDVLETKKYMHQYENIKNNCFKKNIYLKRNLGNNNRKEYKVKTKKQNITYKR